MAVEINLWRYWHPFPHGRALHASEKALIVIQQRNVSTHDPEELNGSY